jgi:hypothetical protein
MIEELKTRMARTLDEWREFEPEDDWSGYQRDHKLAFEALEAVPVIKEAMTALRDDMLRRAEANRWQNDGELVVECGTGVWIKFNQALAHHRLSPGAAPMTPTQEDREAAAAFWTAYCGNNPLAWERLPPANQEETASTFMRHRLAAEERGARMALEVAEDVWSDDYNTFRNRLRQIDPASLGAE